jgi:PleD family two-component response regulator
MRATVEEACASDLRVTILVGAAAHRGGGMTPDELIALANRAACRAKSGGRNAVAVSPPGDPVAEAERLLLDALDGML